MGRRQGSQQGDRGVLWQLGTVICCAVLSSASRGSPVQLHSAHPHAVERAEFAVRELQGLSDTGIFRTLSLKSISAAATQDGVFHYNTLLTLDLASPYFSSGRQEERFEVVVMEHKEDGHISFSIDSFPDMDPVALEHFYIQKVDQHRQSRDMFFSKIDRETDEMANPETSDPAKLAVAVMDYDPHELLVLLNTSESPRRVHTPAANLGLCVDHCRTIFPLSN
ncbi:unnamed protein product [Ectocarpus sp. 6 AP-2014]